MVVRDVTHERSFGVTDSGEVKVNPTDIATQYDTTKPSLDVLQSTNGIFAAYTKQGEIYPGADYRQGRFICAGEELSSHNIMYVLHTGETETIFSRLQEPRPSGDLVEKMMHAAREFGRAKELTSLPSEHTPQPTYTSSYIY